MQAKVNDRYKSFRAMPLFVAVICVLSCAPPKKVVEFKPQPIPPLNAKIYESPGIDWRANKALNLELRETGKSDTASNQILERYLLRQIRDCFNRKGYEFDSSNYSATVRVYFGVKEEKIVSTNTLAYGISGGLSSGVYFENYRLGSSTWQTAGLAVTAWSTRSIQETIPIYDGEITVEIFDRAGTTQLWRGDIRAPLSSDDIRIASNQMIREVLWYLPALDYPAVSVPSVRMKISTDFGRISWRITSFIRPVRGIRSV